MSLRTFLLAAMAIAAARPAYAVTDPVDLVVYGDHVPAKTLSGGTFVNPIVDGTTRLRLQTVPGMQLPSAAAVFYGLASWGKYVFVGNFDDNYGGLFGALEAPQRIGVYNTETKEYCDLAIDADPGVNASVEWIIPADPQNPLNTRLYFNGFVVGAGHFFGYIEADMTNPNPCDPETGWRAVGYNSAQLNAAAAGLGASKIPCPNDPTLCDFDGINVLKHDATQGDLIIMNNWFDNRVIVTRVDPLGGLHVPDVRVEPGWAPVDNDICYRLLPVARPGVDPTRSGNDLRFTVGFDRQCDLDISANQPPCAPFVGACPLGGTNCTLGGTCPNKYCSQKIVFFGTSYQPCSTDADCVNLGTCTDACLAVHPAAVCSNDTSRHCAADTSCSAGGDCGCNFAGVGKPAQEYRFDGTTITPVSAFIQADNGVTNSFPVSYDSSGGLWLGSDLTSFNGQTLGGPAIAIFTKQADGEHSYYDLAHPDSSAKVPPQQALNPPGAANIFLEPWAIQPVGTSMFLGGKATLWRGANAYGLWTTAGYAPTLAYNILPGESGLCSVTTSQVCDRDTPCPAGETCNDTSSTVKSGLTAGGSPLSIWSAPDFQAPGAFEHARQNLFLIKSPYVSALPDNSSNTAPGMAWDGQRMWLVANHNGALSFRVRDGGFWSSWYPMPTNVAIAGGAAVISNGSSGGTWVEVFARGAADGKVYGTSLSSALDCAAGSCSWYPWSAIPVGGSVTTDVEPAATYFTGGVAPMVVVRNVADNRLYWARRVYGSWSSMWTKLNNLQTDLAPTVAFNSDPSDGRYWIAATDRTSGKVRVIKVMPPSSPSEWEEVGASGSVLPWGTAPTLAFDGSRMRMFVAQGAYPGWVYQTIHDGSGWGAWRVLSSQGISTRQSAAANVYGSIDLATNWYTAGIAEQSLE